MIVQNKATNTKTNKSYVKADLQDVGKQFPVKYVSFATKEAHVFDARDGKPGFTKEAHFEYFFEDADHIFTINRKLEKPLDLVQGSECILVGQEFNGKAYFNIKTEKPKMELSHIDLDFGDIKGVAVKSVEIKESPKGCMFKVVTPMGIEEFYIKKDDNKFLWTDQRTGTKKELPSNNDKIGKYKYYLEKEIPMMLSRTIKTNGFINCNLTKKA